MATLLLPWNVFPDISEYPRLIITRPTQQPNIRMGQGLVMEVAALHYQGPIETLTLQLSGGGTLPPVTVTVTNVTPPFQVLWSEFSPWFEHSLSARATLPDGRVLIAQRMRLRLPNAVEVTAPTQGSVFIAPIDIRYLMFVENFGPTHVRLLANPDQVLANLWISFSPPGLVSDVMDHTIRNVPPGHYEVHAVLGDFNSMSGVLLPGAVSPSVSFVVLDRHTTADLDRDGLPDLWEIRHGLDPARPDADEDPDNDGLSNFHEMLAGTAPNDPRSNLSVEYIRLYEGILEIAFPAVGGRTYRLESTPAFSTGPWQSQGEPIRGTGGLNGFRLLLDPHTSGHTSGRFYRVAIVP